MRNWSGIEDNASDIGDDLTTVENMSFYVKGELGRRLGFGARIANSGIVVGEIGSLVVYVKSNGNIEVESQ